MKTYVLKIVIEEGSDEFWEELDEKKSTGCDEILREIDSLLSPWDAKVTLTKYEDK